MRHFLRPAGMFGVLAILAALSLLDWSNANAQGPPGGRDPGMDQLQRKWDSIQWQNGPTTGKIGSLAEVQIPQGYKFADCAGLLALLELTQNSTSERDLAVVCPQNYNLITGNAPWFLTFEWEGIGYVKDEEKNNLDGNTILDGLTRGQEQDNQRRRTMGFPTLKILGWSKAPFYDPQTNLLTWATRIGEGDQNDFVTINYNSRILGRDGVMSANLVIDEKMLDRELPTYQKLVKGFSYVPGKKYAEFRAGDKVATLGLTAPHRRRRGGGCDSDWVACEIRKSHYWRHRSRGGRSRFALQETFRRQARSLCGIIVDHLLDLAQPVERDRL